MADFRTELRAQGARIGRLDAKLDDHLRRHAG
jgi:hypothetical protein